MSRLGSDLKRQLAERVQYYRELGIHDFYCRNVPSPEALRFQSTESEVMRKPQAVSLPIVNPELQVLEEVDGNDRPKALRQIREVIGDCTRCKLHRMGRKQIVFGVGNPDAELMFIGEAPGADEDEQGEPFVGRAGQLLNNMIVAMGLRREDVYIANVIKCRPPGNRTPERDECETCSPFLLKQIEVIKPKAIVALGAVAAKNLLSMNDSMANLRGRFYDFRGTKLAVTYHPAFLLRDPRQKKEAWKDLQMVMEFLGLPTPVKSKQTE